VKKLVIGMFLIGLIWSIALPLHGDVLYFHNDEPDVLRLWLLPMAKRTDDWAKEWLYPYRNTPVNFVTRGRCFVVLRDTYGGEERLGFIDLHTISNQHPNGVITLQALYETKTREHVYTVLVPVWEVFERNGIRYWGKKYVREQRTKTSTYTVRSGYRATMTTSDGLEVDLEFIPEQRKPAVAPTDP
jgi:hypothetical protein